MKNRKGALTVEACIALPVFLCFFLLLAFFIKVACINMVLDHAVNETAKQIATTCYPISFLNEMEDSLAEEGEAISMPSFKLEKANIDAYMSNGISSQDIFSKLFSGNAELSDVNSIISSIGSSIEGDSGDFIKAILINVCKGKYLEVKTRAKYIATKSLMDEFCDKSVVDKSRIKFILVEVPQAAWEFSLRKNDDDLKKIYDEMGYSSNADDVVVYIEYKIKVPVPFFGSKEIVLRHTAVEKAWLSGSNGIYSISDSESPSDSTDGSTGDNEENSNNNNDNGKTVYITRTGDKYHYRGCQYLARSCNPISLNEAESRGYGPCKICVLGQPRFGK